MRSGGLRASARVTTCQRRASCLEGFATTKTSLHHNRVNAFLHDAMQWFKKFEDERRLSASPVMIAASLHQMAEKTIRKSLQRFSACPKRSMLIFAKSFFSIAEQMSCSHLWIG